MSEVQSRSSASRGRVSARGGRGGYSSRGGRGGSSRSAKADNADGTFASEDEGEFGQMKKKYANTLPMLKELFPDWTDEDLVFALEEVDGDLEQAIDRITEGNVSQWGEVKKKTTEKKQPKAKEVSTAPIETTAISARGGRGRGGFEGRGRARGDRGRGGRGGRGGVVHANGSRPEKSAVTTTTTTTTTAAPETPAAALPETKTMVEAEPAAAEPAETGADASKTSVGTKKGWASLFAKPAPPPPQKAPAAPVPTAAPVPPPVPAPAPAEKPAAPEPVVEKKEPEKAPIPVAAPAPVPVPVEKGPEPVIPKQSSEAPVAPAPVPAPKDDLTRNNLAQIPDVSPPAPTATAASTVGSHFDQATQVASTPSRQPAGGVPTSAFKQTPRGAAARRVMEQQEAVVMPGNHAVDRAAVQFGSMGLNGDSTEVDIDENREDAETRAQPPQHSPVAPRASLPPSTQHQAPAETPVVPRPAPGLPPVPQTSAADSSFDFARYTDAQKPYDPFTQPVTQPQPQIQEPFANQAPVQPTVTTNSDFTPFYSMDQRLPYNYYGGYSQSQDASLAQRAAAGFGVSGAEVQPHVPTTQPPGRYGHVEAPNSGHTTPNPTLPGATQTPTAQHMPGQSAHAAYGYGYPYYSNPHYASYMSQMTQHQYGRNRPMYDDARRYDDHYMPHSNQYGYGSQYAPYGKGGMYNQPQGFSYDHSSSPATAGSFNQAMPGRDSMYGGRTGSAQPSETQQTAAGSTAFGSGMSDVFGRSPAGFGQNQPMSQQPPVTAEEAPKSFDTPKAAGPSPSLAQANRPGSAANNVPGQPQAQTSLPPLQAQQAQQGFGGYPQLGPQYGAGLGSLGAHQGGAGSQSHHQASGYGNYGGAAGFANYYGNSGRGGWAGNYTH